MAREGGPPGPAGEGGLRAAAERPSLGQFLLEGKFKVSSYIYIVLEIFLMT